MTAAPLLNYAEQWDQDDAPLDLTLPSGKVVQVRQPDALLMAKQGLIPDSLTPIVEAFIFEKEKTLSRANAADQPPGARLKAYADYMRYVDVICVGACVNPVLRFAPKRGELAPDRLSIADRIHIWKWAEGLVGELAPFPAGAGGEDAGVSTVDGGEADVPAERAHSVALPA